MRVALLDDDPAQLAHLTTAFSAPLREAGMAAVSCVTFSRGEALRRALRTETFDLLVLDWNMPDLDGFDLLHWLRVEKGDGTPVIMLTGRGAERDVASALGLGADDYVVKPFRPLELRARATRLHVRSSAAKSAPPAAPSVFGGWRFDRGTNGVHRVHPTSGQTEVVRLTETEFITALTLFQNLGKAVSRAHLIESAGYESDESRSRSLDIHIYRIRGKLLEHGRWGFRLQTVYGQGYRVQPTASVTND